MASKFSLEGVSYSSILTKLGLEELNKGTSYFHTPIPAGLVVKCLGTFGIKPTKKVLVRAKVYETKWKCIKMKRNEII